MASPVFDKVSGRRDLFLQYIAQTDDDSLTTAIPEKQEPLPQSQINPCPHETSLTAVNSSRIGDVGLLAAASPVTTGDIVASRHTGP